MKNKVSTYFLIFCIASIYGFLGFPLISYASNNPTLVRILNYYADNDGRITFKWQQDYNGCATPGFNCSGGIELNGSQFSSNGGEGFYNTDGDFGSNWAFMNFTTTCNELTSTGRICISHPKILINRNNNAYIANNNDGLLYSDVAGYVNPGGQMNTIFGGIFWVVNNSNYMLSKTNSFSFGDAELPYTAPVSMKNPVLIVPGLLGTELKDGNTLLWADLNRMFADPADSFMDLLALNKNLSSSDSNVSAPDVIKKLDTALGLIDFDYTDGLITEFKNQGYIENQTLFTFPYDWRYGASGKYADGTTNSDLLGQKIQQILTQTGADAVDVVAHSQGGLIVKKYVADHPTSHHIGKAVFVGVPNTGAPKAINALLQGDNAGIPWLSQDEMKKLAANMPAIYDLAPSQQYYDNAGSFVKVINEGQVGDFNAYTEKDLDYQDFGSFLTNDHSLNSQALTNAENLHTKDFDNFDLRTAGIDLYSIDGCKAATVGKIIEDRSINILGQNLTDYKTPKFVPGDNTVPLESATNLPVDSAKKFYLLTASHSTMLSQDGSRQEIVNLISGSSLGVNSKFITQDIGRCNLNGKAISIFSPVNIFVTDQNGNTLGNAADGSVANQIPGADFEIMGDHKFLFLPTDDSQTYSIAIQGTGTGTFTIKSQNIANSQPDNAEVFSNLPVTPNLTGNINLGSSPAGQDTLSVKTNSGSAPVTILPSAVVAAEQFDDSLAPVSSVIVSGTAGQPGFYRSDVKFSINSSDPIIPGSENQTSGVLSVAYNLDNSGYKNGQGNSAVVTVSAEGNHAITFFAIDNAGNKESEKTVNFTIDKTAPEAIIAFDPTITDLKFSGTDNISSAANISVSDKDNIIIITDQAGNTTEIDLKNKNRKIIMTAEILSIKYNGVSADISKNGMVYSWLLDKNKNLIILSQYVKSKNYNILAVYDGKNTKMVGLDSSGIILKSVAGLKIMQIKTNNGNLNLS